MKKRFPFLGALSVVYEICGAVAAVLGVLFWIGGMLIQADRSGGFAFLCLWLFFGGLFVLAFGEAIRVFMQIEENTRKACLLLEKQAERD